MQKLQKWMYPFLSGSKALYQENKRAWELRRRLQEQGQDLKAGTSILSREEMLLLRQAHRDLLKSLPLMVLFFCPIIG